MVEIVWSFHLQESTWQDFEIGHIETLERAFHSKEHTCTLRKWVKHWDPKLEAHRWEEAVYLVDFAGMKQTQVSSGFARKVRRCQVLAPALALRLAGFTARTAGSTGPAEVRSEDRGGSATQALSAQLASLMISTSSCSPALPRQP
jgi:hypothetical protein